jgi:flavin reductase (DIM6/NTAB) family NADH-FMN oxidoreductase RutF
MAGSGASAIFESLDRELWLVTAAAGPKRGGLIATFVGGVSLVPELPRACVAIARHHHTWSLIESQNCFALHLLGKAQLDWVWRFGLSSGHDGDKFEGLSTRLGLLGSPLLEGAIAWMECRVETRCELGDRTLYIAEVVDASGPPSSRPLTVREMSSVAPEDRRAALETLRIRDIAIDSQAIRDWRQRRIATHEV